MATVTQTELRDAVANFQTAANEALDDARRHVRRTAIDVRRRTEDAGAEAAVTIRRHPFAAVGIAAGVGVLAGVFVGIAAGWQRKRGR